MWSSLFNNNTETLPLFTCWSRPFSFEKKKNLNPPWGAATAGSLLKNREPEFPDPNESFGDFRSHNHFFPSSPPEEPPPCHWDFWLPKPEATQGSLVPCWSHLPSLGKETRDPLSANHTADRPSYLSFNRLQAAPQNNLISPDQRTGRAVPHLLRPTAPASASRSFLPQPPNSLQRQQQPSSAHHRQPLVMPPATWNRRRGNKKLAGMQQIWTRRRKRSRSENKIKTDLLVAFCR